MANETVKLLIRPNGAVTVQVNAEKLEVVFLPDPTIAPQIGRPRPVEIIYQCGSSEFVLSNLEIDTV